MWTLIRILSQLNTMYTLTPCSYDININIIGHIFTCFFQIYISYSFSFKFHHHHHTSQTNSCFPPLFLSSPFNYRLESVFRHLYQDVSEFILIDFISVYCICIAVLVSFILAWMH
jgi:hypothetical protein